MILLWLIVILAVGGGLAWMVARSHPLLCRSISLAAVAIDLVLALDLASRDLGARDFSAGGAGDWFEQVDWSWIPQFGIHFHLGVDGLSLLLVLLTLFLGMVAVLISWTEITTAIGFFHFNLLWILAAILGALLSLDLFLFYFSWELMLVPMYFLISIWGRERRTYAAVKFFLFTQLSSLLMLISILALYFAHHQVSGAYTFEYTDLLATPINPQAAMWIMLGFFIAFAVKLPMFPLHTWLPDACAAGSTASNVVLASLLAAASAYGMIRFLFPLFPDATREFAPVAMTLGVVGILYGAVLAFSQTDLTRLFAYASISHLGFVLLAIFAGTPLALEGAVMTLVAHGISTGALFLVAGALESRTHTRELDAMGGLWDTMPRFSGAVLFFALASLGLPGLGDFIGEFLILLGTYRAHVAMAAVAAGGVLASTFYSLRFVQKVFQGPNIHTWKLPDLAAREGLMLGAMMVLLLWLGLYPQPVFHSFAQAANHLPALWR
jgi:NADH-quinone oxidoreductase subunit M